MTQFLHCLLTPVAEFIIVLPSMALYCNPIFLTYKLLQVEGRSAANKQWKIPDISSFMCTRSCSQPHLCLPVLSCAQVTQQKYLEQDANTLTRGSSGWIFFTSPPSLHTDLLTSLYLYIFISSFFFFLILFPLFEEYQVMEERSTCILKSTVLFDLTII